MNKQELKDMVFTAIFMGILIVLYFTWEVYLANKGIIE